MISAVVVCAGKGKRMGKKIPKQFLKINGLEIFMYSVNLFQKLKEIDKIVVVVPKRFISSVKKILKAHKITKATVVEGGEERYHSVYKGLLKARKSEVVLVHDGVRPFPSRGLVKKVIKGALKYGACIPVLPVDETLKLKVDDKIETVDRKNYFISQTPQGFKYNLLLEAYKNILKNGIYITDEGMAMELAGYPLKLVRGERRNIKITYPEDIQIAESYIEKFRWKV